jgi:hypothetical protein
MTVNGTRTFEWITRGLLGCVVMVLAYNVQLTITLSERVAVMESSQFTNKDGLQVWREIAQVKEGMAAMPQMAPPAWFVDRVARLEAKMDRIDAVLAEIRASLKGNP